MTSRQQFSPLCDLHYTSMRRVMLEEDAEEVRSFHSCRRPDCTRIFRDCDGYLDWNGAFDQSRALVRRCPTCGEILYLSELDHFQKIEIWECPQDGCDYSEEFPSPSAR